jgi:hypothetical protein
MVHNIRQRKLNLLLEISNHTPTLFFFSFLVLKRPDMSWLLFVDVYCYESDVGCITLKHGMGNKDGSTTVNSLKIHSTNPES